MTPQYNRVVVKLSGEALMGNLAYGISPEMLNYVAEEIQKIYQRDVETALVVGGGNIFRGIKAGAYGMDRTSADHMGMLATVMNSLALQDTLQKKGVETRVQTAIRMKEVAEPYILRKAIRHLEKKRVVIFAAGTGNPFFTTDTAAVLRAKEIQAAVLIKATKVNGIYDRDPEKDQNAKWIEKITYREVIEKQLRVMDMTAISLAMDNYLPLEILSIKEPDNIDKFVCGQAVGTYINC
ncbi:MAG: uridylate kinase [Candidatus Magnetoglobus multicellularis str. Araruama]|uniref:Uridylate kinase n=1 Tax=Candidatus Magnetoglobus multicellularis str. Araruama TaxID=890399 RepID=A0A1V1P6C0_9BACT|nr:MAG: uridylate kinase [Candidatus Magnetoglobus multicellularis str. Araruama]